MDNLRWLLAKETTADKMVFALENIKGKQKTGIEALTIPFSLYKLPLTEKEITLQKE